MHPAGRHREADRPIQDEPAVRPDQDFNSAIRNMMRQVTSMFRMALVKS